MANRISYDMTTDTIVNNLCDNDEQAKKLLNEIINKDPLARRFLFVLDEKRIYGIKILKFWNECCSQNFDVFLSTIKTFDAALK